MNTTISKFVDDLFVERWTTKINYSSYYEQCSPLLCSYLNYYHTFLFNGIFEGEPMGTNTMPMAPIILPTSVKPEKVSKNS
ncbi:unnamed protein product [Adineta ricciae]|uniref:Uncharacterized protein n=1 Tax=Adineta ricciae TaxID=249248 RepID=A0A815UNR5_ADIRI|nr:unnamed protein product [Adineta ricciae]